MATAAHQPAEYTITTKSVAVTDRHQDALLHELRQEVMELRAKQGDINALRDQVSYLNNKHNTIESEKNQSDQECSQKLFEGMQVIDSLVAELDEFRQLNRIEEEHQVQLLQQLSQTCCDHDGKQAQLKQMAYELQSSEARNAGEQRELDMTNQQLREAQQTQLRQSEKINELRERAQAKDDSNEASKHSVQSMKNEIEATENRIRHQREVIAQRDEDIMSLDNTSGAAKNEIVALKYDLKQLDNEICYYEEQNRRHQQAQSQLVKANEYEVCRAKELQVNEADARVRHQTRCSEHQQLEYELNGLKDSNQIQIDESNTKQNEIEALNRHMNLITQQNFELSSELQRFLQTDEVVKTKLNRRSTVDEIRHKVDLAVKRSQREVDTRRSPRKPEPLMSNSTTTTTQAMCYRHTSNERTTSTNARTQNLGGAGRGSSPLRSKSPPRR